MYAILRHQRISPKKANLVAGLIREKTVAEGLNILKFTPKKGANILYKVLHSAASNAEHNFKQEKTKLIIKEILVTKGVTMKRSLPVSRGRSHPILKRTSHIIVRLDMEKIELEQDVNVTETKKTDKPKKETTKTTKVKKNTKKIE